MILENFAIETREICVLNGVITQLYMTPSATRMQMEMCKMTPCDKHAEHRHERKTFSDVRAKQSCSCTVLEFPATRPNKKGFWGISVHARSHLNKPDLHPTWEWIGCWISASTRSLPWWIKGGRSGYSPLTHCIRNCSSFSRSSVRKMSQTAPVDVNVYFERPSQTVSTYCQHSLPIPFRFHCFCSPWNVHKHTGPCHWPTRST